MKETYYTNFLFPWQIIIIGCFVLNISLLNVKYLYNYLKKAFYKKKNTIYILLCSFITWVFKFKKVEGNNKANLDYPNKKVISTKCVAFNEKANSEELTFLLFIL